MDRDTTKQLTKVVQIDEGRIQAQLGELVRGAVEETLNKLFDTEVDALCNAPKYSRLLERADTRAGHYTRKLHTRAGDVELRMPEVRKTTFEKGIIERHRRRESSVEEAFMEMYLVGASVRRVENITEARRGTRVSPGTLEQTEQKRSIGIFSAGISATSIRCHGSDCRCREAGMTVLDTRARSGHGLCRSPCGQPLSDPEATAACTKVQD